MSEAKLFAFSHEQLAALPKTGQLESHSISSLSRRILASRETCRSLIESGVLVALSATDHGHGSTFVFHSSTLDAQRAKAIDAVSRRVASLEIPEQQKFIVEMHAQRALHALSKPEN